MLCKLALQKNQSLHECSDDITWNYALSIEATADKEEIIQMEVPWYSSLYLFHNNRNSLREWIIDDQKQLSFRNIWENSSNWAFIYSIYLPKSKQLILADTNTNIKFITFADVKQEI